MIFPTSALSRRAVLAAGPSAAILAAAPALARPRGLKLRPDFIWGAATSAHQVEGGNVNSDSWVAENLSPSAFAAPSGDACDSWNRWRDDIDLVKSMRLNTYRFGIEWARIEPEPGLISNASLLHYRAMIDRCNELGIRPFITYSHFTVPRWFAANGGWEDATNVDHFVRFCETAARALGPDYGHALTFNEPNLAAQLSWTSEFRGGMPFFEAGNRAAAKRIGSDRWSSMPTFDIARALPNQIDAHRRAYAAIKAIRPDLSLGLSLAVADEQPAVGSSGYAAKVAQVYQPWFEIVTKDDFVGVQTYGRNVVGPNLDLPPPASAELTETGMAFFPEALGNAVAWTAKSTGRPIIVTENGVATKDDPRRIVYIDRALASLGQAIAQGADVRGYIHWSLLDNFEWNRAFSAHFGLASVDPKTFVRRGKPSGLHLGTYAVANRL